MAVFFVPWHVPGRRRVGSMGWQKMGILGVFGSMRFARRSCWSAAERVLAGVCWGGRGGSLLRRVLP